MSKQYNGVLPLDHTLNRDDGHKTEIDVLAEIDQAYSTLNAWAYSTEMTVDHIQADAMKDVRDVVAIMIEALKAYEESRNQLFHFCLSNGVFNFQGERFDCTEINYAHYLASKATSRIRN